MDIHLPVNRDSSTPIIMVIHGGAWIEGKKEDMNSFEDGLTHISLDDLRDLVLLFADAYVMLD